MKTLLLMFGGTDFGSPGCIPTSCGGIRKVVHFAIWGAPFVGGRRFAPPYRSGKSFTPGNLSQNPLFGVHVGKWWKRRGLKFHRTVWQEGGKYDGPDGTVEPIGLRRVVVTHTLLPATSPKIHFLGHTSVETPPGSGLGE